MGHLSEITYSQNAAKDVALNNRLNGVTNHSAIGYMVATELPGLVTSIFEGKSIFGDLTLGSKSKSNEPEEVKDNGEVVQNQKSAIQNYKQAYNNFVSKPSKETAAKLKEACDNAKSRSITDAYKQVTKNPKYAEFFGK